MVTTDIFQPARSRLLWLPTHLGLLGVEIWLLGVTHHWYLQVAIGLIMGASFAGLAFLAHEALHGAVVRRRWLRHAVGFVGFLPFTLSPRLWVAWHNREHHGHTNQPDRDPDAYPTLHQYRTDERARWMVELGAPGLGRWRGLITLLLGLTVQSIHMLVVARRLNYLTPSAHRAAIAETLVGAFVWASLGFWRGPMALLYAFLIPLLVANVIVMMHITTNHSLSPQGHDNDPLHNSLTVHVPRWFSFWTLGFGYHVEHHLFPAMSGRYAPHVAGVLQRNYPTRYQTLPLGKALLLLHQTPRVYAEEGRLIDLKSGQFWSTLPQLIMAPVAVSPVAVSPVAVSPVAVSPVAVSPVAVSPVAVSLPIGATSRASVAPPPAC